MGTNLEKWKYYLNLIKLREVEYIVTHVTNVPKILYDVVRSGDIKEKIVTDIIYWNLLYFSGKKPTRVEVAEIKDYYENPPELTLDGVRINYYEYWGDNNKYKSSSSVKYVEMFEKFSTTKKEADGRALVFQIKVDREAALLENGHVRCTYCRKIVPENESVKCKIIFQNSRSDFNSRSGFKKFVDEKINVYCSNQCGGYDQMGHEG